MRAELADLCSLRMSLIQDEDRETKQRAGHLPSWASQEKVSRTRLRNTLVGGNQCRAAFFCHMWRVVNDKCLFGAPLLCCVPLSARNDEFVRLDP